jgi:hypothetical protein
MTKRKPRRPADPLRPEPNPPAPNRSAAGLRTVFVGGARTRVSTRKSG